MENIEERFASLYGGTPKVLPATGDNRHVLAVDKPGPGGACHNYVIAADGYQEGYVHFQKGPVHENGYNGCMMEDLLAIVKDRLESFQTGPYPCRENATALDMVTAALAWLTIRTENRQERGVEGISKT